VTRVEIEREVLAWIAEGVHAPRDDARFERLALALFRLRHGAAPRIAGCARRSVSTALVRRWRDVSAAPTGAFRRRDSRSSRRRRPYVRTSGRPS
jgi:hypothetical protein